MPDLKVEFSYLQFDIKYIYVQGNRANAQVLTVIDVLSRWNRRFRDAMDKLHEEFSGQQNSPKRED